MFICVEVFFVQVIDGQKMLFLCEKTKKWRVVKMQRIKLEIYLFITAHITDIELGLRFLDILSNLF